MTMTASDYRAIAEILAGDLATCANEAERRKVRGIAFSLSDYFARTNDRFNRDRFYMAVGVSLGE